MIVLSDILKRWKEAKTTDVTSSARGRENMLRSGPMCSQDGTAVGGLPKNGVDSTCCESYILHDSRLHLASSQGES